MRTGFEARRPASELSATSLTGAVRQIRARQGLSPGLGAIDPAKRVTGLIITQILPFEDTRALKLYGQFERGQFERGMYAAIG
jgi:hypothetical protein